MYLLRPTTPTPTSCQQDTTVWCRQLLTLGVGFIANKTTPAAPLLYGCQSTPPVHCGSQTGSWPDPARHQHSQAPAAAPCRSQHSIAHHSRAHHSRADTAQPIGPDFNQLDATTASCNLFSTSSMSGMLAGCCTKQSTPGPSGPSRYNRQTDLPVVCCRGLLQLA